VAAKSITAEARGPILLVDDNAETRQVLERILAMKGYPSVTARSGEEALAYLRGGGRPSAIVLDIRMPGMDGTSVRAALAADPALAGIPVVVFTADPEVTLPDVVANVRKASDPDILLDAIAAACAKPS